MHGIVVHTDGRPAAGISVATGGVITTTDAAGRFTLERQPEWGNFVVLTRPTGYSASPWWHRIPAPENEETTELRFELVPEEQTLPYQFLHLTDTHMTTPEVLASGRDDFGGLYREGSLPTQISSFFARVNELAPEALSVMITGDLVDHGLPEEYEAFLAAVAVSPVPVHVIPGNHDHMDGSKGSVVSRNNYATNSGTPNRYEQYVGPRWYSFDVPGLHVVAMDWHSHELGIDHEVQNAWVKADLAQLETGAAYILLFHDQPAPWVLDELPWQPIATFSGHWHTSRVIEVDGTLHVNSPTSFFAGLDYSPPGFRHVTWDGKKITIRTQTLLEREEPAALPDVGSSTFAPASVTSSDESLLWRAEMFAAGHRQRAAVQGNTVYVGGQIEDRPGGAVEAFDLATGELRWRTATAAAVKTTPAPAGGVVVAAEVGGDLLGLDAETGAARWRTATDRPLHKFVWGAPTVAGDIAYIGDQAELRAINVHTGETLWRRTDLSVHRMINHAAPLIVGDLLVMGFFPTPTDPIGVDTRTGQDIWDRSAGQADTFFQQKQLLIIGTAAYDEVRDVVLIPAHGLTTTFDRGTGALRWRAQHEATFSPATPLVTHAGYVITIAGYGIRMLDPETGATIWDAPVEGDAPFPMSSYNKAPHPVIAPPTLVGEHLLLPGLDGVIRRFDLRGNLLGSTQLASPIAAELLLAGDRIIAVGTDGCVMALDAERAAQSLPSDSVAVTVMVSR